MSGPYFEEEKAFHTFIEQVKRNESIEQIHIGLDPDNIRAVPLYTSLGFELTGERKDGGCIYCGTYPECPRKRNQMIYKNE